MRQEFQQTGQEQVISSKLAREISERLERREQAMILLNRRGYSPVVLCRTCGKTLECKNCAIALTHHKRARKMECHYCGYTAPVPQRCLHCGSEYVYFLGTGSDVMTLRNPTDPTPTTLCATSTSVYPPSTRRQCGDTVVR